MKILIVTKKTEQVCSVCRVGRSHFVKVACIDKEYCLDNSGSQERCSAVCWNLVELVHW